MTMAASKTTHAACNLRRAQGLSHCKARSREPALKNRWPCNSICKESQSTLLDLDFNSKQSLRGPLIQARFVAMLLLVYHHLGDSWKSACEASTSRLVCFTTGFPGAPKGSPLQLFPNGSNAVHRCGDIQLGLVSFATRQSCA